MDKDMVFSVVNDSMQFLKEDNPVQDVWYRGIDNGGYFMLINNSSGKALTAKSKNRLTIEGTYSFLFCHFLLIYYVFFSSPKFSSL